jgi:hypothetical protein
MLKYPMLEEDKGDGSGNGGGGEGKWHDGLAPEMLSSETVQNSPDLATFVKQALDTASHVGSSIRVPGPDAGPEATADFHKKLVDKVPGMYYMPGEDDADAKAALYQKLGKPQNPAAYEIVPPEGSDEAGKRLSSKFVEWADELNLTKAQAQGVFGKFNEFQGEEVDGFKKFNADSLTHLKAEWGAAFDQKMAGVTALAEKSGMPQPMVDAIKNGSADGDTLKWMSTVADGLMSGKPEILDQGHGAGEISTPTEAAAQIQEIMNRKEYWEQGTPLQKQLMQKVQELQKLANPAASTNHPSRAGLGFE